VLSLLPGLSFARVFLVVPKPLRDAVYDLVARNRYRIFGRFDACIVPDADLAARVIE
jgi:predicted DCC family thiol-disulfide oxidoreductase YuxK